MTRNLRNKFLEPIGVAEVNGSFGLLPKMKFGWFIAKTTFGSWFPTSDLGGVESLFPLKRSYIKKALKRNRVLGRRILMIIARYQKSFMDQSFLLGDEGGIFDQLCSNLASLSFALSLDSPNEEYLKIAAALNLEADLKLRGQDCSASLQESWAEVGRLMMNKDSLLYKDLIGDIDVADIPLDPRFVDRFI